MGSERNLNFGSWFCFLTFARTGVKGGLFWSKIDHVDAFMEQKAWTCCNKCFLLYLSLATKKWRALWRQLDNYASFPGFCSKSHSPPLRPTIVQTIHETEVVQEDSNPNVQHIMFLSKGSVYGDCQMSNACTAQSCLGSHRLKMCGCQKSNATTYSVNEVTPQVKPLAASGCWMVAGNIWLT